MVKENGKGKDDSNEEQGNWDYELDVEAKGEEHIEPRKIIFCTMEGYSIIIWRLKTDDKGSPPLGFSNGVFTKTHASNITIPTPLRNTQKRRCTKRCFMKSFFDCYCF